MLIKYHLTTEAIFIDGLKEYHRGGWTWNVSPLDTQPPVLGLLCNSESCAPRKAKPRTCGGGNAEWPVCFLCQVGRPAPLMCV